jgi:hypothetical protein
LLENIIVAMENEKCGVDETESRKRAVASCQGSSEILRRKIGVAISLFKLILS